MSKDYKLDDWFEMAKKELREKELEELTWETPEGIKVKPLYTEKDLEKIILCDVQKEIYPSLEKAFLNLLHNSGFPDIKFEKKIDFENLYSQRFN